MHHLEAQLAYTKIVKSIERATGRDQETVYTKVTDRKTRCSVEFIPSKRGRMVAHVFADIPPNSPETSWEETDDVGSWVLVVKAAIGKTNVTLRYDIPVADRDAYSQGVI